MMKKNAKQKIGEADSPAEVTITYDLYDLPTAQHKAGSDGDGAEKNTRPKFHAAKLDEFKASRNCAVQKQA